MRPDDVLCRGVHEVPAVDPLGALQVEPVDPFALRHVASRVSMREDDEGAEPHLVPFRAQQRVDLRDWEVAMLGGHASNRRDGEPEEFVALAVLARACLEEPPIDLRARRSAEVDELLDHGAGVTNSFPSTISYRWPSSGRDSSVSTVHGVGTGMPIR